MSNIRGPHDYVREEVIGEPWSDRLARRLLPQTKRLNTLAVSSDGRAALGLSSYVSVLNPVLIIRAVKSALPPRNHAEQKPFGDSIVSSDVRAAREIRPPVLGHELVFQSEQPKENTTRMDTVLGFADIAFLSWAPCSSGSVLYIANGEGTCFAGVPRFGADNGDRDGTWGGLLGMWRFEKLFQGNVSKVDSRDVSCKLITSDDSGGDSELCQLEAKGRKRSGLSKRRGSRTNENSKRTRKTQKELPFALRATSDEYPRGSVICVAFCKVFKTAGGKGSGVNPQVEDCDGLNQYILVGRKDGTFVYLLETWKRTKILPTSGMQIHVGWSSSIACLEDFKYSNRLVTMVAVGGPHGDLCLYGIWMAGPGEGPSLGSTVLWKAEPSVLCGPIGSLSWNAETLVPCKARLAIGTGNSIVLVDCGMMLEACGDMSISGNLVVHRIRDAHDQLVSSVRMLVDGSIVSSSLDGSIAHWKREKWNDENEGKATITFSRIQTGLKKGEPVMAMERTVTGFGIFSLSTCNRVYTEVNALNEDPKYAAGSRRSIVSLFVMPQGPDGSRAASHVLAQVEMLASTRRHVGEAISMWDMELFLEQADAEEKGVLPALRQRLNEMVEVLSNKSMPKKSKSMYDHYARVVLCLAELIVRVGSTDISATEAVEGIRGEINKIVRCGHYDNCLESFLKSNAGISKATLEECRALESMCKFACICNVDMMWDGAGTMGRVREIRKLLGIRLGRGESMELMCGICGPEVSVPLVCDAGDANSFYCAEGDVLTRCVLTGLPVLDAVPVVCYGCDARGVRLGFDGYEERDGGEFEWIVDVGRCGQCFGPLLPSSVEIQ